MRPSEFSQKNPVKLDVSRSKFTMEPRWTGTFGSYSLVPVFTYSDVLPGDTFKLSSSFVIRMTSPIVPVMDDLWLDLSFYFVPHELILSRSYMSPATTDSNASWKAFIGAQDFLLNMPVPDSNIQLPHLSVGTGSGNYLVGGIADCMGCSPCYLSNVWYYVNALPFLAFMAVWNENYRDPSTQNPGVFSINSSNDVLPTWLEVGATGLSASFSQWKLPNVCRFHGYFGSALPWPQRNNTSVDLPLGTRAPVITGAAHTSNLGNTGINYAVDASTGTFAGTTGDFMSPGFFSDGTDNQEIGNKLYPVGDTSGSLGYQAVIRPTNLWADLQNAAAVSINTFRLAVQEQRWYEALARGGNRIDELTAALFGVVPHDAGSHAPEYLGGKRIPLQVSQVNVTANSSSGLHNNTAGSVAAFSLTSDSDYYFTKSFDKWGTIIGVACVRYRDSFGYGLNRMFTRHERFDYYFPQFANLGEQPVYRHELDSSLMTNGANGYPTSPVFGYQEAWADYRTIPDIVTGLVRPAENLSYWTYAGSFGNFGTATGGNTLADYLSGKDAYKAIDRTLQVASSSSGLQFIAQFQHSITAVRPMPLYSIPGLVDHH